MSFRIYGLSAVEFMCMVRCYAKDQYLGHLGDQPVDWDKVLGAHDEHGRTVRDELSWVLPQLCYAKSMLCVYVVLIENNLHSLVDAIFGDLYADCE